MACGEDELEEFEDRDFKAGGWGEQLKRWDTRGGAEDIGWR
jgi:hypothetical protein